MNNQMKIGLIIVSAILLIVCIKAIVTELPQEIKSKEQIKYNSTAIQTYLYIEGMKSPRVDVIDNLQQLYDYAYTFSDNELDLQFKKYTNSYFEDNILLIVTIQEGSSSITNSVAGIEKTNGKTINIKTNRKVPQTGDTVMAMSHLVIELDSKYMKNIEKVLVNKKQVDVYYN